MAINESMSGNCFLFSGTIPANSHTELRQIQNSYTYFSSVLLPLIRTENYNKSKKYTHRLCWPASFFKFSPSLVLRNVLSKELIPILSNRSSCFVWVRIRSTHIAVVPAVAADASDAAVDHLDAAEHKLQQAHPQQYGEQHDVPQNYVFRPLAIWPHGLVPKIAAVTPEKEKSGGLFRMHNTDTDMFDR